MQVLWATERAYEGSPSIQPKVQLAILAFAVAGQVRDKVGIGTLCVSPAHILQGSARPEQRLHQRHRLSTGALKQQTLGPSSPLYALQHKQYRSYYL